MVADRDDFRGVLRRVPQCVTVVSAKAGDVEHGMTAASVTVLSMEPPLYLICIDKSARAHDIIADAGHFVVNVLSVEQQHVSNVFANKALSDEERWAEVTVRRSSLGAPKIDGCVAYIECVLVDTLPGGDHTIYVGEVQAVSSGVDKPSLVLFEGGYRELAPPGGGL